MTVKEIIKKYLVDNGYDGLAGDCEIGCDIEELLCCDENDNSCGYCKACEAGYKYKCPEGHYFAYIISTSR